MINFKKAYKFGVVSVLALSVILLPTAPVQAGSGKIRYALRIPLKTKNNLEDIGEALNKVYELNNPSQPLVFGGIPISEIAKTRHIDPEKLENGPLRDAILWSKKHNLKELIWFGGMIRSKFFGVDIGDFDFAGKIEINEDERQEVMAEGIVNTTTMMANNLIVQRKVERALQIPQDNSKILGLKSRLFGVRLEGPIFNKWVDENGDIVLTEPELTINLIGIDYNGRVYFPEGALDDIVERRARLIGKPELLDMGKVLRTFRFIHEFDLSLDKESAESIKNYIKRLSISEELQAKDLEVYLYRLFIKGVVHARKPEAFLQDLKDYKIIPFFEKASIPWEDGFNYVMALKKIELGIWPQEEQFSRKGVALKVKEISNRLPSEIESFYWLGYWKEAEQDNKISIHHQIFIINKRLVIFSMKDNKPIQSEGRVYWAFDQGKLEGFLEEETLKEAVDNEIKVLSNIIEKIEKEDSPEAVNLLLEILSGLDVLIKNPITSSIVTSSIKDKWMGTERQHNLSKVREFIGKHQDKWDALSEVINLLAVESDKEELKAALADKFGSLTLEKVNISKDIYQELSKIIDNRVEFCQDYVLLFGKNSIVTDSAVLKENEYADIDEYEIRLDIVKSIIEDKKKEGKRLIARFNVHPYNQLSIRTHTKLGLSDEYIIYPAEGEVIEAIEWQELLQQIDGNDHSALEIIGSRIGEKVQMCAFISNPENVGLYNDIPEVTESYIEEVADGKSNIFDMQEENEGTIFKRRSSARFVKMSLRNKKLAEERGIFSVVPVVVLGEAGEILFKISTKVQRTQI